MLSIFMNFSKPLDSSTTIPNACHWGFRVASPKGLSLRVNLFELFEFIESDDSLNQKI